MTMSLQTPSIQYQNLPAEVASAIGSVKKQLKRLNVSSAGVYFFVCLGKVKVGTAGVEEFIRGLESSCKGGEVVSSVSRRRKEGVAEVIVRGKLVDAKRKEKIESCEYWKVRKRLRELMGDSGLYKRVVDQIRREEQGARDELESKHRKKIGHLIRKYREKEVELVHPVLQRYKLFMKVIHKSDDPSMPSKGANDTSLVTVAEQARSVADDACHACKGDMVLAGDLKPASAPTICQNLGEIDMPTTKGDTSLVTGTEHANSVSDDVRHQGIGDTVQAGYLCVGSQSMTKGNDKPCPKPGGNPSFIKVIDKEGKYLRSGRDGHEEPVPASGSQTGGGREEEESASDSSKRPKNNKKIKKAGGLGVSISLLSPHKPAQNQNKKRRKKKKGR